MRDYDYQSEVLGVRSWVCGACRKIEEVEETRILDGIVAAPLPEGWTWQAYLSRRIAPLQPGRVDLALGCCAEHALEAARKYGEPVKIVPMEDSHATSTD